VRRSVTNNESSCGGIISVPKKTKKKNKSRDYYKIIYSFIISLENQLGELKAGLDKVHVVVPTPNW
jgi:hypothetical protein